MQKRHYKSEKFDLNFLNDIIYLSFEKQGIDTNESHFCFSSQSMRIIP